MPPKIWQIEDVRNHLQAVRSGLQANSRAAAALADDGEQLAAYQRGWKATLEYLARRFGVTLNGAQPAELRLKMWSRQEVNSILAETQAIMYPVDLVDGVAHDRHLAAYYRGVERAIQAVALSFGIRDVGSRRRHI